MYICVFSVAVSNARIHYRVNKQQKCIIYCAAVTRAVRVQISVVTPYALYMHDTP